MAQNEYGGALQPQVSKWSLFTNIIGDPKQPENGCYVPHEGQRPFHESCARFRIMSGGARGGKSRAAAADVLPLILTPGSKGWIVAPNYELGAFIFDYLISDLRQLGISPSRLERSVTQGRLYAEIEWDNGQISMFRAKSAARGHEEGLLGEELDWCILEEASRLKELVWREYIRSRLRSRKGIAIFVSSPHRYNWFRDICIEAQDSDEWDICWNDANLNPGNLEKKLTEKDIGDSKAYMEQVLGIAASDYGLVFPEFKPDQHVIQNTLKRYPHLEHCPVACGIDWGYRDPTCVVWVAVDGEGEDMKFYVLQEYSRAKRRYPRHASAIRALSKQHFKEVEYYVCDWDPAAVAELKQLGLTCKKAKKDKEKGLDAVGTAFEEGRLFIDAKCKNLIKALQRYEMGDDGKPLHAWSDMVDATRYIIRFLTHRGCVV